MKKGFVVIAALIFVVQFLHAKDKIPPAKIIGKSNHEKSELKSSEFEFTVDSKGYISSISDNKNKKDIPFKGETVFKDCSAEVLSVKKENGTIVVKKKIFGDKGQMLNTTEIFSFENGLLKWEIKILPEGNASWSVPVQTIWSMNKPGLTYWTTWGDPRPEVSELKLSEEAMRALLNGDIEVVDGKAGNTDWADPLTLQPLYPRKLMYGASILGDNSIDEHFDSSIRWWPASSRNYFSVPVIGLFDEKNDIGVSVGFSPKNIGIEATLDVTPEKELIFSRYNNRFTPGKEVQFTTFIKLHEANWRSALSWYVDKFSNWFNPVNPNVHKFSGTSSYSSETGVV